MIQSKMKDMIEMMRGAVAGDIGPGPVITFSIPPYISSFRFRSTAVKGDRMSRSFGLERYTMFLMMFSCPSTSNLQELQQAKTYI